MTDTDIALPKSPSVRLETVSLTLAALSAEYSVLVMPFVLAAMMETFRLSEAVAARLVSLQLLFMALGSALVSVSLRPGRSLRPLLAFGGAAIALANAICASLHGPVAAAGGRALTGLGEGVVAASATAAVCATSNPHRVFSVIGTAAAVAAILALLVAPFVSSHAGPSGLFWVLAFAPLLLFPLLSWVPVAKASGADLPPANLATLRRGAPVLLAYFFFWAGSSGLWVYAERIGASQGLSPQQMGFWLSLGQVGAIPGPILAAWAGPRIGLRACIVLGCLSMGVATVSFIFGGYPLTYGLGGLLASFWLLFVVPCFRSRMASLDPSGRTVALSVGVYTAGFGVAPLTVSTVTLEGHGYASTGLFCLMCFVASALLGIAQRSSVRPTEASRSF